MIIHHRGLMIAIKKISILGVGTLGTALITGLIKSGTFKAEQIRGTTSHPETAAGIQNQLKKQIGQAVSIGTDNIAAVQDADIVVLAVKPQNMKSLLKNIDPVLDKKQLLISAAAGVPLEYLENHLSKQIPLIRAMPNMCIASCAGMTGLAAGRWVNDSDKETAQSIFKSVGEAVFLDEKLFNALTALSASGPAYLYVVVESLAEAGVKLGMPREVATLLAAQSMLGAAKMLLETGQHPALLKDAVTTPAGCTIDGLMELEEGKLRVTLIKAVVKAAERAYDLLKI